MNEEKSVHFTPMHTLTAVACHVMLRCDNSYFQQMVGSVPSHDIAQCFQAKGLTWVVTRA